MFEGQYLFSGSNPTDSQVFGPWMSRSGDNLRVTYEAMEMSLGGGSGTMQVGLQVYHKNSEDPGSGVNVGTDIVRLFGTGIETVQFSGLKELVRYKFFCAGPNANAYVLFRVLSPIWFDDVAV